MLPRWHRTQGTKVDPAARFGSPSRTIGTLRVSIDAIGTLGSVATFPTFHWLS